MLASIDQTGNKVEMPDYPGRIVSLVPSLTELLFDLDLNDQVSGITRFCIHPKEFAKSKLKVGGTKDFDISLIRSLNPDLIIASKEENIKEGIEELMKDFPVWVSDIKNLPDSYEMMNEIGRLTGREENASYLVNEISAQFNSLEQITNKPSAVYFIWRNPYMTVGGDTFIHHLLERCGFNNLFEKSNRYPVVSEEALNSLQPDYIFLSSEPYPFKERHIQEFQEISPRSKVILVDGEFFSWYGSRLKLSPNYLKQLIRSLQ